MEEKKLIRIKYAGAIPELGYILGPIQNPYREKMETIEKLVAAARKVFEVNPKDSNDEVLLTSKNVKLNNFTGKKEDAAGAGDSKKEEEKEKEFVPNDSTNPTKTSEVEKKDVATAEKTVVNTNTNTTVNKDTVDKNAVTEKKDETVTPEKSDFTKK